MCEFKVFLSGEQVFSDVIYAVEKTGRVLLRTVLGEEKVLENCRITEVDVEKEILRLEKT